MKSLFFIFSLLLLSLGLSASPVPYSGKVSIDGVNFNGTADFRFELRDENGTVHWRNAQNPATSISVPVQNGRYVVLLGGQGMVGLPSQLFIQHPKLWVRVQVDFRDGQGSRLLQPDQRVRSVPHALSADLAKSALRADSVADQGVSARSLDPALKAYLAPLLKPVATGSVANLDRLEGSTVTLSGPAATGENLTYQWKKDSSLIPGATAKDLVFSQLQPDHGGSYEVVVSNDFGSFSQLLTMQVLEVGKIRIAGGGDHIAFIDGKGSVWTSGKNSNGQLGAGDQNMRTQLTEVFTGNAVEIQAGSNTTLFLTSDNELYAMGETRLSGIGRKLVPTKILSEEVLDFDVSGNPIFVVKKNGSLWAWGSNYRGQFGNGTYNTSYSVPQLIQGSGVSKVETGWDHTVFLKNDGSLWAMGGNNLNGQNRRLGINSANSRETSPQLVVSKDVKDFSVGGAHTLFLKQDGSAWGFGSNRESRLGPGGDKVLPIQILQSGVAKVSAGSYHSLFLMEDGSVLGIGNNGSGQLGGGGLGAEVSNPKVLVVNGAVDISAGAHFSIVTKSNGQILVLGANDNGQLGTGEPLSYQIPQRFEGFKVKSAIASQNASYFVDLNDSLWSLGNDSYGHLGNGAAGNSYAPVKVVEGNVSTVSSIYQHLFYLDQNGTLMGFGGTHYGKLNSSIPGSTSPKLIKDGNVISFSAGGSHSAYVLNDGSLWTFGRNHSGQLGDSNTSNQGTPLKVVDANVTQVSAGGSHTLFIKNDGSVWAVGENGSGQLGDGTSTDRNVPVKIIDENATGIFAAISHSFVLMNDGSLLAFGSNGNHRAGLPSETSILSPQLVFASGVQAVSGGANHSLFLKNDGSLWASGFNQNGKVGAGAKDASVPLTKIVDSGVAGVSAGHQHSLYWKTNGDVYVFGSDASGQLGLRTQYVRTPRVLYDPN